MCNSCNDPNHLVKGIIPNLKTDPKYKDAPRFNMIYEYEGEFKDNYNKQSKVMATELMSTMASFIKQQ